MVFRYAETLLNYAEALAELDGVGNAQKIIDALQPLRDRVGMPPVDFDREYNQEADYVSAILISIFRLYVVNAGLKKPVKDAVRKISCAGLLRTN